MSILIHSENAITFNLFGLTISVYGLLMAVGFIVAYFIANYLFHKNPEFKKDIALELLLIIFPLSIIGARVYYCVFSETSFTFLEFLQIWNGGLAIYGGIIGGLIGVIIYSLVKKINLLKLTDVIAVVLILAQAIGRVGCYFGGCCYGIEVTNPNLMWFPLARIIDGVWVYSTFFYIKELVEKNGFKSQIIAGIPSFCAVAAKLGMSLALENEQIHIIPDTDNLEKDFFLSGTLVFMKSGKNLSKLKDFLISHKNQIKEFGAVSNCGFEDEKIMRSPEELDEKLYLTVVIVKTYFLV